MRLPVHFTLEDLCNTLRDRIHGCCIQNSILSCIVRRSVVIKRFHQTSGAFVVPRVEILASGLRCPKQHSMSSVLRGSEEVIGWRLAPAACVPDMRLRSL